MSLAARVPLPPDVWDRTPLPAQELLCQQQDLVCVLQGEQNRSLHDELASRALPSSVVERSTSPLQTVLERIQDPLVGEYVQMLLGHVRVLEDHNKDLRERLDKHVCPRLPEPASLKSLPSELWDPLPLEVKQVFTDQAVLIAALEARVAELKKVAEDLQRRAMRQAARFSKGEPKKNPERPGQKKGHAGVHRRVPDHVDETIELTLDRCPHCLEPVQSDQTEDQYVEDIPPIRPHVTRFIIHSGYCKRCGERVRPPADPRQLSLATGAAGVQLGASVIAVAADMKYRLGLSFRKIVGLLGVLFGLAVSPGGLVQATARLGNRLKPLFDDILRALRESSVVHADETGWRIGGRGAWLWVFANLHFTLFVIRLNRGHEVILKLLGEMFAGVLCPDGAATYDAQELSAYDKAKCVGHVLVDLSDAQKRNTPQDPHGPLVFVSKAKALLQDALRLKKAYPGLDPADYATLVAWLELGLDVLLDVTYSHPDDIRLSNRLRKQRPYIFKFLYRNDVDGTNNLAERQLRPGVILRKLSAGNRTDSGAETHSVLASVLATSAQQGLSFMTVAAWGLLRFANLPRPTFALPPPKADALLPPREYKKFPLQKPAKAASSEPETAVPSREPQPPQVHPEQPGGAAPCAPGPVPTAGDGPTSVPKAKHDASPPTGLTPAGQADPSGNTFPTQPLPAPTAPHAAIVAPTNAGTTQQNAVASSPTRTPLKDGSGALHGAAPRAKKNVARETPAETEPMGPERQLRSPTTAPASSAPDRRSKPRRTVAPSGPVRTALKYGIKLILRVKNSVLPRNRAGP